MNLCETKPWKLQIDEEQSYFCEVNHGFAGLREKAHWDQCPFPFEQYFLTEDLRSWKFTGWTYLSPYFQEVLPFSAPTFPKLSTTSNPAVEDNFDTYSP